MAGAGDDVIPEGQFLVYPVGREPSKLSQAIPAHRPDEGQVGDCFRTAIACLLGEDDPTVVPHFVADNQASLGHTKTGFHDFRSARLWLREHRGLDLACIDRATADEMGVPYVATVRSQTGDWPHSVIARQGQVIHDPSGRDYGLGDYEENGVDVLVEMYDPDPDELLRQWEESCPAVSGDPMPAESVPLGPEVDV